MTRFIGVEITPSKVTEPDAGLESGLPCSVMDSRMKMGLAVNLSPLEKESYPCRPIRLQADKNLHQCDHCGAKFKETEL